MIKKVFLIIFIFLIFSYFSLALPYNFNRELFLNLRIPRFIGIIITGFSLSTAGMMIQLITKNPLADPFIIGTSGGAMLAIIICDIIGFKTYGFVYFFLISLFSITATFLAYRISMFSSLFSNILLSGIAINSFILSIIVFLIIFSRDASINFFHLGFGSFSYLSYDTVMYSVLIFSFLFFLSFFMIKYLIPISFDEEKAQTLGINVNRLKFILFILVSLITSVSVSISGMIGFVGLMIPHITRKLFKNENFKFLFVINSLLGSIFLLVSDVISKSFFYPVEIPPGVITSIIGSIFFLILVIKRENL